MKRSVVAMYLLLPLFCMGQHAVESPFITFANLKEVLDSAKKSQKNIFIDAYASWCGPCKKMDAEIYCSSQISSYLKSNFISIKIQFDKTSKDAQHVKDWYKTADIFAQKYNITEYPTYIFLSPDAELLQLDAGYMDVRDFLVVVKRASDPKNSYTQRIAQFRAGQIPPKDLSLLALKAKNLKNDSLALEIAKVYKNDYYDKQPIAAVIQNSTPEFIGQFLELYKADDSSFCFFRNYPEVVDSLVQEKGYASKMVEILINRDFIQPLIKESDIKNTTPDWKFIESHVVLKYGEILASKLLFNTRLGWHYAKKDWGSVVKFELENIERNGLDTAGIGKNLLNNLFYSIIFMHATDSADLSRAAEYMQLLLSIEPNKETWLDTYANLLYKSGRKQDALRAEEKALSIARQKRNEEYEKYYLEIIYKMKNNQPTWLP
jgi:thioredoxin-related protein